MLSKYCRYVVKNYLFAVLAFVFTVVYWVSASSLPKNSIVFPRALTWVLVPLFLWNLVESVRGFRRTLASDQPEGEKWDCSLHLTSPKLVVTGITLLYIILMPIIGFAVTTAAYLAGLACYLGVRRLWPLCLFTVVYMAIVYGLFVMWLRIRLPDGILF